MSKEVKRLTQEQVYKALLRRRGHLDGQVSQNETYACQQPDSAKDD